LNRIACNFVYIDRYSIRRADSAIGFRDQLDDRGSRIAYRALYRILFDTKVKHKETPA